MKGENVIVRICYNTLLRHRIKLNENGQIESKNGVVFEYESPCDVCGIGILEQRPHENHICGTICKRTKELMIYHNLWVPFKKTTCEDEREDILQIAQTLYAIKYDIKDEYEKDILRNEISYKLAKYSKCSFEFSFILPDEIKEQHQIVNYSRKMLDEKNYRAIKFLGYDSKSKIMSYRVQYDN